MMETKRLRVVAAFERLEELARRPIEQRDDNYRKGLAEAKSEYHDAEELPEWPFGWKVAVGLATSGVISNLAAIFAVLVKRFSE